MELPEKIESHLESIRQGKDISRNALFFMFYCFIGAMGSSLYVEKNLSHLSTIEPEQINLIIADLKKLLDRKEQKK